MENLSLPVKAKSKWNTLAIEHVRREVGNYLILSVVRPEDYSFQAGQHATLSFTDPVGEFERSYSIASPPKEEDFLEFCIQTQNDGRAAAIFKTLKAGDVLKLSEAKGSFKISNPNKPLIFIAGGSGISPLRSFTKQLLAETEDPLSIRLFYGSRDADGIPFKEELLSLSESSQGRLSVILLAEAGEAEGVCRGNTLNALLEAIEHIPKNAHYYLCGPPNMVQALQTALKEAKVSENAVFVEKY